MSEQIFQPFTISTLYGQLVCDDILVKELIESPAFERLQGIRQYGTCDYARPHRLPYSRYDHSLGVFSLLHRYHRSRAEYIAGLLHDISHTVFSHATEGLFQHQDTESSYQDAIHEEFLNKYGISTILRNYNLVVSDIHHKNSAFTALEQNLPNICADRLEYNLYAGVMDGFLSQQQVNSLLDVLVFSEGEWFFTDQEAARVFAQIPLYETINRWSSPEALLNGLWTSEALKRALNIGLITQEDIHYAITDDAMWNILKNSHDPTILYYIERILSPRSYFKWGTRTDHTVHAMAKFRGVNPWVKATKTGSLIRLTDLDTDFKNEYNKTKAIMDQGWYLKVS